MFFKLSLLATSLFVVSCVAPGPPYPPAPPGTANQCCVLVGSNSNTAIQSVGALFGVDVTALSCGLIAISCVPITVAVPVPACSNTAVNCNVNQLGAGGNVNFLCVTI